MGADVTKLLGVLLIANAILVTGWWVTKDSPHKGWAFTICLVAVFVGIVFLVKDRAIEITVRGVGTIKAASEQAAIDAQAVRKSGNASRLRAPQSIWLPSKLRELSGLERSSQRRQRRPRVS
jgi:hypothetical protein